MPFRFHPLRRLIASLRSEVPFDYRTLCFAFFVGSVFSVPFGLTLALTRRPFVPPEWVEPFYWGAVILSFVILPFWSGSILRSHPLLRRIGFVTFSIALIVLLIGTLFPALS